MGITAGLVADQLRAANFGATVSEMQVRGRLLEVTAILFEDDRRSLAKFDDFIITRPDGSCVLLSVVADVKIAKATAGSTARTGCAR